MSITKSRGTGILCRDGKEPAPRVMRLAFIVEYDGSRFRGYQAQPGKCTVQTEFERTLSTVLGEPVRTTAAGRTDAGVHAIGQVISCVTESRMPLTAVANGMRVRLPQGIRVRSTRKVAETFHPRHDALRRAYRYVMTETLPASTFLAPYVTRLEQPMDWDRIAAAAAKLLGTHNLASFTTKPAEAIRLERAVERIEIGRTGDFIHLDFEARAFLRGMIRNIMGWLFAVGRGDEPPGVIDALLASSGKQRGIDPAPPEGLYLMKVTYPAESGMGE